MDGGGTSFLVDPALTLESAVRYLEAVEVGGWTSRDRRLATVCLQAIHVGGTPADPEWLPWLIEIERTTGWQRERALVRVLMARLA